MNKLVAMCVSISTALLCWTISAHPQSAGDPKLDVRLSTSGNQFTCTITNLGSKTLTAYSLRDFYPHNKTGPTQTWDSMLSDVSPIEPNAQFSRSIGVSASGPYPDRVELVAGIWADGETFGEPLSIKQLLDSREARASDFERVAKLIQRGLDENWKVDQYLHALDAMPSSLPVYSLSSTLKGSSSKVEDAKRLHHLLVAMLDTFTGAYERIRRAKPAISATTNQ